MRQLPPRAQGLIVATLIAGACIGGAAVAAVVRLVQSGQWDGSMWVQAAVVLAFVTCLSFLRTPLPASNGAQAMGTVGHMAALVILPVPVAVLVSGCGLLIHHILGRKQLIKTAFNLGSVWLTVGISGSILISFGGTDRLFGFGQLTPRSLVAICLVSVVYYCVNVPFFAVFLAYLNRRRLVYTFRVNYRSSVIPEAVAIVIGVIAGFLWRYYPPLLVLISTPVIITHFSYESIRRLQNETIAAVRALAESIDVRDPYTARHSANVAALSRRLAQHLELPDDKVEQIFLAAQVHDLGKMTVPVEILSKNAPLTPDERRIMEQHPATGAAVLSRYKGFGSSVPIVRHHHEHWDGCGYPAGLAGAAIPFGARVVALADAFDAMISDRPYRTGLAVPEALRRIAGGAGTQFDPLMTRCFLEMMAAEAPESNGHLPPSRTGRSYAVAGPAQEHRPYPAATTAAATHRQPMDLRVGLAMRSLFPAAPTTALTSSADAPEVDT